MKKNLDEMLKQALTPMDEPDFWLNQRILNQAKETDNMAARHAGKIQAAVLTAALILGAGSVTAYAAWKYLTPEKVSQNLQDDRLTAAFQGTDAVRIQESQVLNGYKVTLLGIVSGRDITDFELTADGTVRKDRTYAVTAIEYEDGTPMPDTSQDAYADLSFFISPLIKGYDPNWYNMASMHGAYSEFGENGVLYRLTECDNVEIFADHDLYLCVSDGPFYNQQAYDYDESTGEISRNEAYEGLNALFSLPIDPAKADPEAAAAYKTSMQEDEDKDKSDKSEKSENAEEPENTGKSENEGASGKAETDKETETVFRSAEEIEAEQKVRAWTDRLTPENIDQYADRAESTVQVLVPDEDGYVEYAYDMGERGSSSGKMRVSWFFKDAEPGMSDCFDISYSEKGLDSLRIETFTLNEDGTVTFAVYIPKESADKPAGGEGQNPAE